jgi:hypothetical protein
VCVMHPPGFVKAGSEGKVMRLNKALYDLRQTPRVQNVKLNESLVTLGFVNVHLSIWCTP